MASLEDALRQVVMARREQRREPSVRQMLSMARTRSAKTPAGRTWRKTAQDLGVSETTLRRWRHGGHVSPANLAKLRQQTESGRRVRYAVPSDRDIKVRFEFDGRSRDVHGSNLRMQAGTMQAVARAIRRGDSTLAVERFLAGIGDPWYRRHFVAWWDATKRPGTRASGGGSGGAGGGGSGTTGGGGGGGETPPSAEDEGDLEEDLEEDEFYDDFYDELIAEDAAAAENDDYAFAFHSIG